jgi:hypothetical protein
VERDRLTRTLKMHRKQFCRHTEVSPKTFAEMAAVLSLYEGRKKRSGRPAALSVAQQLLLTLEFWREYRTFAHLGDDWGMQEDGLHYTVERVEAALISSAPFQMPRKRSSSTASPASMLLKCRANGPKKATRLVQRQEKTASPEISAAHLYRDSAHFGHYYKCWGRS